MFHSIDHIGWLINLGHQFEILDALADGDTKLVRIDHPGKRLARSLTSLGFREQVLVLRAEHPTKRSGAIKQSIIGKPPGMVGLGDQNIHFAPTQPSGNCSRNVDIHIEAEAQ
jgi:hypothetical protein